MDAAAVVVRRQAERAWQARVSSDITGFRVRTAPGIVEFGAEFGGLIDDVIGQFVIAAERDPSLAAIVVKLGEESEFLLLRSLQCAFLAHEFFHIEQQLGSDQYRDSDTYLSVVSAVDYQADLSAFSYVLPRLGLPEGVTNRECLALLLSLHFLTMAAFMAREQDGVPPEAFDRVLVWALQTARVLRAESEPDLGHPSFQVMPTVSLPKLRINPGERYDSRKLVTQQADNSGSTQDLVISIADGRGLLRVLRLVCTDRDRIARLAGALLKGDILSAREEFEELFLVHGHALEFYSGDPRMQAVEAIVSLAERLTSADIPLSLDQASLAEFFERAELLALHQNPRLPGSALNEYRQRWKQGYRPDMEERIRAAAQYSGADTSSILTREVRRVGIRFGMILESLDARATRGRQ